jgi:YggT family protein
MNSATRRLLPSARPAAPHLPTQSPEPLSMIIIDPLIRILIIGLDFYIWVVIIWVIMSWLVAFNVINARNQFVGTVGNILQQLTEPALRPIRRFLPNLGGVDISPVVLILLIYFLQMVLQNLLMELRAPAL